MPESLTLTRLLDAPRDVVWEAWTDPQQLAQWWGPHGFTAPVVELDVQAGGAIRIDMQGPDGTVYPAVGVFHEITEPERLVLTTKAVDGDGNTLIEAMSTVTLQEDEGKTRLTVEIEFVHVAPGAEEAAEGAEEGWNQTLDRLAAFVSER
jgi:uncharacterized protein YndB with AHSA1/START domain